MAEEVEIRNVGGSDGVASEVTLQKLVNAMNAMAKAQGISSNQLAKAQDAYTKSLRTSTKELDDNADAFDSNTRSVRNNTSAFGKIGTVMVNALKGAANSALGLSKELVSGGDELSDFTQHIPLVGGALTGVVQIFEGLRDNFRDLSEVGAGFNNSIVEITKQAGLSGLTFAKFNELVGSNSDSMLFFGGTVSSGAREMVRLGKDMRNGNIGSGLLALGFTVRDLNEGLISTTQLEARVTGQRIRDEQALVATSQAYLKEIDQLAKITGTNRKQQQQIMLQNAQEANVARMLGDLDTEGRKKFQSNLNFVSTELPGFAGVFKDLADGIPQTEFGIKLKGIVPGFAALAEASATGTVTQEEFISRLKALGPDLESFAKTFDAASTTALMDKDAGFAALFGSMFQFREFMAKNFDPKLAQEEADRREMITQALQQFETVIGQVRDKVFTAFFAEPNGIGFRLQSFLESLTQEDINNFNTSIGNFIDRIGQIIADPVGEGKVMIDKIVVLFDALILKMQETFANSYLARTLLGIDQKEVAQNTIANNGADAVAEDTGGAQNIGDLIAKFSKGQMDNQMSTKLKLRDGLLAETLGEELADYFRSQAELNQNAFLRAVRKEGVEIMAEIGRIGDAVADGTATAEQRAFLGQALEKLVDGGFFLPQKFAGTKGTTGRLTEPRNTIAQIHAGERVLSATEARTYNNAPASQKGTLDALNQLNSTMSQATAILKQIETLNKKQLGGIKGMAPSLQ